MDREGQAARTPLSTEVEATATLVYESVIEVHRHLGPGLREASYERALMKELRLRGATVRDQVCYPLLYKGEPLPGNIRLDLVVNDHVVVEIKSVEQTLPVHFAQLLSYLRHTGLPLGLLVNFNTVLGQWAVRRVIR